MKKKKRGEGVLSGNYLRCVLVFVVVVVGVFIGESVSFMHQF